MHCNCIVASIVYRLLNYSSVQRQGIVSSIKNFTLTNAQGMQVKLSNYGARIISIKVRNNSDQLIETTLNHQTDDEVENDVFYMGATCGRISNRLGKAQFMIGNKLIKLEANEGENLLHGGNVSFSHRFWEVENLQQNNADAQITFILFSENGDQGFPGNLNVKVCYTLTSENELRIDYWAKSDSLCPINMCNHTYFNLGSSSINKLKLTVNANHYLPVDNANIPLGEIRFLPPELDLTHEQLLKLKLNILDLDHCYVLKKNTSFAAKLSAEEQGISLLVKTDQEAMQVYSGNYLPKKHSAIALEAQGLVDAPNQAGFACDWVSPNNDYHKYVSYQFISC